jgi:hypothetical protein
MIVFMADGQKASYQKEKIHRKMLKYRKENMVDENAVMKFPMLLYQYK